MPDAASVVLHPWPSPSGLQLDVLPRISVTRRDRRKHVLPFRRLDARPIGVDEGVPEHRYDVVVFQHRLLNLMGELLAFGDVVRRKVSGKLVVELLDAIEVLGLETAALEQCLIPVGPAAADTVAAHDDVHAWPLCEPAL